MKTQILKSCSVGEVGSIASNTLNELGKKTWENDSFLTAIIEKLTPETALLQKTTGTVRKSTYTIKLAETDAVFDRSYLATKQFVLANTFSVDPDHAENAQKVWNIFEAHDLQLYRLGYEKQIFRTSSLIEQLKSDEMQPVVDSLIGVSESLEIMENSHNILKDLFRMSMEEEAAKEKMIAPSVQKMVVCDLMNDELLPYLDVMSKVKPDVYGETTKVITQYIESVNTKNRARRTKEARQDQPAENN